jgi:tetratricopeptide (TPR) repeat protein
MKRIFTIAALTLAFITLSAQTDRFEQRYNLIVSKLGPAGVGVETLLDSWAKADSTDEKLLAARFNYYLTKAQRTEIVKKTAKKYLGMDPVLTLKDSLGQDVCYYQEVFYDDELFGKAVKSAERAVKLYPDKIDYRFMKANAYISYEKESPDMALAYLMDLIDVNAARKGPWIFDGDKVEDGFFEEAIQEYCFSFYQIGSVQAREAFYALSEKMNGLYPENLSFINNIGTYHLVAKEDYKTALKYYKKVLKKNPEDQVALQNGVLAARRSGNEKLEIKYRQALTALTVPAK